MKRQIHKVYRRTWVGLASIGMLALGVISSGCGDSNSSVGEILSPSATAADAGAVNNMNFGEILDSLDLSDEQRRGIEAAIAEFRSSQPRDRSSRGGRRGGERGGQRGGERGGDRNGPPVKHGPGDFGEQAAARTEAMMTLVGTVGEILSPEQTAVFLTQFAEKREEMRGDFQARMEERRGQFEDGRGGRRGGRGPLAELDLDDTQREAFHSAMSTFRSEVRDVMESVRREETSIEDAIGQVADLARALKSELAGILTADQISALEEWRNEGVEKLVAARLDRLAESMDRRVALLTRVLHLDDAQSATVSGLVLETIPAREALLAQLLEGTLEPASFGLQILGLERTLKDDISKILTPDQQAALDALVALLPGTRPHRMMR